MNAVKEKAYAKINLFLDVVGKRDDGFHDIKTVMHTVSLCDEVTVISSYSDKPSVRMTVEGNKYLPSDSRNLAYRAAALYLERAGVKARVELKLKKKIPMSAGLAGGSTDAAAVLRALNRINQKKLTEKLLLDIAGELGSDVPFCLVGKTALCEGRGEKIERLPHISIGYAVIAIADERVSTPKAYSELDKMFSDFDGTKSTGGDERYEKIISSLRRSVLDKSALFNVFEKSVLPVCQGADGLKRELLELGAEASLMSGSGPSVFGIFKSLEMAEIAKNKLEGKGVKAFVATSV